MSARTRYAVTVGAGWTLVLTLWLYYLNDTGVWPALVGAVPAWVIASWAMYLTYPAWERRRFLRPRTPFEELRDHREAKLRRAATRRTDEG